MVRVGHVALISHRADEDGKRVRVRVRVRVCVPLHDVDILSREIRDFLASSASSTSDQFPGARDADALTFLQHASITCTGDARRRESGRRTSWSRR